jgi:hypothetical protein
MGVAAAIIGGAVIAGGVAASSASKARKAQTRATNASIAEQQRQFDATQSSLDPSIEAGNLAREQQQALLGLSGEDAQAAAFAAMQQSPGQQFLRDRAQKNLLRNSSAIGGLGGGNVRSALVQQGVGFAQQDLQNQFGRLGQLAGQGQSAATSIGQFGQQTSGNIGNALIAGGNARATGILNQNAALQQGIAGVTTGLFQSGLFNSTQPPAGQFNQVGGQSPVNVPQFNPLNP